MPATLTLLAHAKVNLALAVGPPEPPRGYHPIASWFAGVELADTVTLTRVAPGVSSTASIRFAAGAPKPCPVDWPADKDLAVRAHRLLEGEAGRPLPVHIDVLKRIPTGGGLGGGSSDAAAVLRGVNELFDLRLPIERLQTLSAALGSDIAFFLDTHPAPRAAFVTGFGGEIERLASPVPRVPILLLIPPFGCPTGPVYQAYDTDPRALRQDELRHLIAESARTGRIATESLLNDLADPACRVEPRLGELLSRLRAAGVKPHVTGSGSTLFVLADQGDPGGLRRAILSVAPELAVVQTRLL